MKDTKIKNVVAGILQGVALLLSVASLLFIMLPLASRYYYWNSMELFGYGLAAILIFATCLISAALDGKRNILAFTLLITAAGFLKFILLPHQVSMF